MDHNSKLQLERKTWAIELLGGRCTVCGSTDRLEFDHIDRSTKSFSITTYLKGRIDRLEEELKKCQLLCKAHHIEKSSIERSVGHGEGITGKKNCRCDLCGPLKLKYQNANRDKYRPRKNVDHQR